MGRTPHYELNRINFEESVALNSMLVVLCSKNIRSTDARRSDQKTSKTSEEYKNILIIYIEARSSLCTSCSIHAVIYIAILKQLSDILFFLSRSTVSRNFS